jgi:hypothetical protein
MGKMSRAALLKMNRQFVQFSLSLTYMLNKLQMEHSIVCYMLSIPLSDIRGVILLV